MPRVEIDMSRPKLLIVEDVRLIQKIIDRALSDSVFEKRFAGDGGKALEVYEAWHPDIILLDVMLPVMAGFSVLKEIRTNIGDKSTTIIMHTSITEKSDIIKFMKLGIQGYVVKPFDQKEIGWLFYDRKALGVGDYFWVSLIASM